MIAALGMYDLPWLRAANDRLWTVVARHLGAASLVEPPTMLTRGADLHALWRAPDLLLAQSCGYPLVTELGGQIEVVATPRYDAPGCEGAWHRSAIMVRADDPARMLPDLAGRRVGINDERSNSGMNLLRATLAPHAGGRPVFAARLVTGSHARSVAALLVGKVDVAAIDCVTLAHLTARYPARLARLRRLAWTVASPGLPLVTAKGHPARAEALRHALAATLADPEAQESLATLRITGFERLPPKTYDAVTALERRAVEQGYPRLA